MTRRHSIPAIYEHLLNVNSGIKKGVFCPSCQRERYWMASLHAAKPEFLITKQ